MGRCRQGLTDVLWVGYPGSGVGRALLNWDTELGPVQLDVFFLFFFFLGGQSSITMRRRIANFIFLLAACNYLQCASGQTLSPTSSPSPTPTIPVLGCTVWTVAGNGLSTPFTDGPALNATLNAPYGIINTDSSFSSFYITDSNNQRIRLLNLTTGNLTTVAGTGASTAQDGVATGWPGTQANLFAPCQMVVNGSLLYWGEGSGHRIRLFNMSRGSVETILGCPCVCHFQCGKETAPPCPRPPPRGGCGTIRPLPRPRK